jgi:hypothetical protein
VGHDRLAGDAGQVVQGHDFPSADLGVGPGAVLVVLGTLALGLVFGRDPDPDRYALQPGLFCLLCLAHRLCAPFPRGLPPLFQTGRLYHNSVYPFRSLYKDTRLSYRLRRRSSRRR